MDMYFAMGVSNVIGNKCKIDYIRSNGTLTCARDSKNVVLCKYYGTRWNYSEKNFQF